jgi:NadR type nicotinamide-nucleotide adenylyltransferase
MYKHGLILGKFYPLTNGHSYLIEEGLKRAENLTVLICSLESEFIPGYLRYNWIKEKFPKANVIHLTNVPDYPETYDQGVEKFWEVWTQIIKDNTPEDLDVVFTSEEYGNQISDIFGIKHECVDKLRVTFNISGTEIRANPMTNWEMIPHEARHFFAKKVVLVGPESTGKTILSRMLADHYETTHVPEYGRRYTDCLPIDHNGILAPMDFSRIAAGQLQWEDEFARTANKLLVCDTDLMTTQTWAELYNVRCPAWIATQSWNSKYHLHLLLTPDVPWINDGTRIFPHLRKKHFHIIKRELDNRKWRYEIINGDNYKNRLEQAIQHINKIMGY